MIASCIFHILQVKDFSAYKHIRLMADGCPGQNKNSVMVSMIMYWLDNFAPNNIEDVTLIFPTTGHSYMPPDRVFGNIEREIKTHATITKPEDLITIIKKFSNVLYVPKEITVYDFRTLASKIVKEVSKWPFKISQIKRVIVTRQERSRKVVVRGEQHYRHDVNSPQYLFKAKAGPCHLKEISEGNALSDEKRKDVGRLLEKHFGENWRDDPTLTFYVTVLDHSTTETYELDDTVSDGCQYLTDSEELIV